MLADGSMEVTENITVRAEGNRIRRGITRDFPTRYRDEAGNRLQALGARARSLQSGMIHHSLAISAVAIAVLFVVILFSASLSF